MPAPLLEGQEPLIASRYRVLALLGEGGMGSVYRVRDETQAGRLLALKRLGLGAQVDTLRFRREFHTLANLRHPGIVQVFEFGVEPRGPFYTMELLERRDLSEVGSLPVPTALRVLRDVAETLAFIHSRRLLHRDLTRGALPGRGHAHLPAVAAGVTGLPQPRGVGVRECLPAPPHGALSGQRV